MLNQVEFHIKGKSPLMVHNAQLADPTNKFTKAIAELTKKRTKTDEDRLEIARLEFHGGLYLDAKGHPCLPGVGIDSAIVSAAKKRRQGPQAKAGIITDGDVPILYDGPKNPGKMWASGRFADTRGAIVSGSRVMRTRPIFPEWELKWATSFDPELLNARDLIDWVDILGRQVGLYEFRPRYGRFEVVSAKAAEADEEAVEQADALQPA